jgi:DNA-binding transcriptional MerR regulator
VGYAVPYSALQAARLARCTRAQLAYWERTGLVVPGDAGYTRRHLVALRVVAALLAAGLSLHRVRAAVTHLLESGEEIDGLRLVTDGDRVWACRDDAAVLAALGQGLLAVHLAVGAFAREVDAAIDAFDAERTQFVARLCRATA